MTRWLHRRVTTFAGLAFPGGAPGGLVFGADLLSVFVAATTMLDRPEPNVRQRTELPQEQLLDDAKVHALA